MSGVGPDPLPDDPELEQAVRACGFMSEINIPMVNYKHFYSTDAESQVRAVNFGAIEAEPGVTLSSLVQPLLAEFNTRDYDSLLAEPTDKMILLTRYMRRVIGKGVVRDTVGIWPPTVTFSPDVSNCLLFIVALTHLCGSPETVVHWASTMLVPENWHDKDSITNAAMRAICLCHRKRKVRKEKRLFWAEVDSTGQFTLYLSENGQISDHFHCQCGGIKVSKDNVTVTVLDEKGHHLKRFEPVDAWQGQLWTGLDWKSRDSGTPAPLFMATTVERPILPRFLPAVYQAVTANDLFLLRALIHFSVTKIPDHMEMCEALLDIFAHAGKVTQLLLCLCSAEFNSISLTPETILRSNSILTTMMKVFILRFAGKYTENVLVRLAKYVAERGDLKIGNPNANEEQVKPVVSTVLSTIFRSGSEITPEVRHIASILRACATSRFNSKMGTYCTLSGFFNLRYMCPFFTNPTVYTTELQISENIIQQTLVPLSGLLLHIANLCPMAGRFEPFSVWNTKLKERHFPDLVNFILSIGDINEQPEYEPPSDERLREALLRVVSQMSKSHEAFFRVYNEIAESSDHGTIVKWNFAAFLNSYFSDNITDSHI